MNIKYNENNQTIEIKDGLKTHHMLIKSIMILNLVNAILNVYDVNITKLSFMSTIWIFLALLSIFVLYIFFTKKSSLENIPVKNIEALVQKTSLGSKRYTFKLTNGKTRDLNELKTIKDVNTLKKMLTKIGVKS
ncbi:hypothetical protein DZC78_06545 [Olleya aquimaris]|uniref:Uncharacterized protein n=1 Tax=Olleya sediminilitoris TaxID=2795739 RepID=A0ABS1WPB5_9FLAO|nr:hypothetical protein [Olleya sediminilitoris]AXO80062.1 hypothetical protein DZC78_06545 [Olleya aquimaris]MBL7560961.1 hypothetical protein [Olleya sediminilitoris]